MPVYQRPRGTYDLFGKTAYLFHQISAIFIKQATLFGYQNMETPMYEPAELFVRNIGELSDLVHKELFAFYDKSQRHMVLKPENTVGILRALQTNKLLTNQVLASYPQKYYYLTPIFRYERPQQGRYRQFYQFGVESVALQSLADQIEVLLLANQILDQLGLLPTVELQINYLANITTRQKWITALQTYFAPYAQELTPLSQQRLATNPLRILDDKVDGIKPFVQTCPALKTFYSETQKKEWADLQTMLTAQNIQYVVKENLVRGLDYYAGLVFEYVTKPDNLAFSGETITVLAGGAYDQLTSELGLGNHLCMGFALGVERIMQLVSKTNPNLVTKLMANFAPKAYLAFFQVPLAYVQNLLMVCRNQGVSIVTNWQHTSLQKHFKAAESHQPAYVAIIGPKEHQNQTVVVKNQSTQQQVELPVSELATYLQNH